MLAADTTTAERAETSELSDPEQSELAVICDQMNTEREMREDVTHCWDVRDKIAIADDLQQKIELAVT